MPRQESPSDDEDEDDLPSLDVPTMGPPSISFDAEGKPIVPGGASKHSAIYGVYELRMKLWHMGKKGSNKGKVPRKKRDAVEKDARLPPSQIAVPLSYPHLEDLHRLPFLSSEECTVDGEERVVFSCRNEVALRWVARDGLSDSPQQLLQNATKWSAHPAFSKYREEEGSDEDSDEEIEDGTAGGEGELAGGSGFGSSAARGSTFRMAMEDTDQETGEEEDRDEGMREGWGDDAESEEMIEIRGSSGRRGKRGGRARQDPISVTSSDEEVPTGCVTRNSNRRGQQVPPSPSSQAPDHAYPSRTPSSRQRRKSLTLSPSSSPGPESSSHLPQRMMKTRKRPRGRKFVVTTPSPENEHPGAEHEQEEEDAMDIDGEGYGFQGEEAVYGADMGEGNALGVEEMMVLEGSGSWRGGGMRNVRGDMRNNAELGKHSPPPRLPRSDVPLTTMEETPLSISIFDLPSPIRVPRISPEIAIRPPANTSSDSSNPSFPLPSDAGPGPACPSLSTLCNPNPSSHVDLLPPPTIKSSVTAPPAARPRWRAYGDGFDEIDSSGLSCSDSDDGSEVAESDEVFFSGDVEGHTKEAIHGETVWADEYMGDGDELDEAPMDHRDSTMAVAMADVDDEVDELASEEADGDGKDTDRALMGAFGGAMGEEEESPAGDVVCGSVEGEVDVQARVWTSEFEPRDVSPGRSTSVVPDSQEQHPAFLTPRKAGRSGSIIPDSQERHPNLFSPETKNKKSLAVGKRGRESGEGSAQSNDGEDGGLRGRKRVKFRV